jgi:ribosomal protein S12 methylthiotransferase accessory factor
MTTQQEPFYHLGAGISVAPLGDGNVLLQSDTLAVRLEGESALFFVEQVLPLLDGQHSLVEVAASLPELSAADLKHYLDALVRAQVLRVSQSPHGSGHPREQALAPFLAMLDLLRVPIDAAMEALRRSRVAIFGLEGHGAELASYLARSGVGTLVLVDPYPCQVANVFLMPLLGPDSAGKPRQNALRSALEDQGSLAEIELGPEQEVTCGSVAVLASKCHMLVSCFDKGFSSVHHWINQASLVSGIPAIYAEARAHLGFVGPLVLPGQTGCYMCYRMRNLACADDFNQAMSYEEALDRQKRPALHERGVLPALLPYMASIMALEILKYLLSLTQPSLAGTVLEFDALALRTTLHPVIQEPGCPVCGVKKKCARQHPTIMELQQSDLQRGDVLNVISRLVSTRTGIIRHFGRVEKDASEPAQPYVYYAETANFGFADQDPRHKTGNSGKGITLEEAQTSALGEAVERYSGARWDVGEIIYAQRGDLEGENLDPRRLVLYAANQYADLPYAPYTDEATMGWVQARSLVRESRVWVPALAVFMNYQPATEAERICPITSNGLAAGSTLLDAILKATCEVLERDAFMLTWLNRLPCRRIAVGDHPQADVVKMCEAYRRRQVEMQLYLLATDHPCYVFAALGVRGEGADGPAVLVGLGADLDPARAARQALLEVAQTRPVMRQQMRRPETQRRIEELVADPRLVTSLDDHALLYASARSSRAFDFMFSSPQSPFTWQPRSPESSFDKLQRLIGFFSGKGWDLIYYNLTPSDMEELGIHTARAIVPDFQPIDFGWKERRLGGKRLYEFPQQVGLIVRRVTQQEINPDPQPLA